ncbi:YbaB/EbfC family nucleoid-associated protein [Streptomyces sp. NPDC052015]|uniref:YbaB/EbfC family nucleoid-associated protein n=1 Tax=Streptomyces sp. NPDC052015 TaxID=3154755 RepID=UPI003430787B
METSRTGRLENVLADFAERYATLSRAREQLKALTVTTRSRNGVVEVTVGAHGRPVRVRFVDQRFRGMAAPQLRDSVLEALTTARAEVAARAAAVMAAADLLPRCPHNPGPGASRHGRGRRDRCGAAPPRRALLCRRSCARPSRRHPCSSAHTLLRWTKTPPRGTGRPPPDPTYDSLPLPAAGSPDSQCALCHHLRLTVHLRQHRRPPDVSHPSPGRRSTAPTHTTIAKGRHCGGSTTHLPGSTYEGRLVRVMSSNLKEAKKGPHFRHAQAHQRLP